MKKTSLIFYIGGIIITLIIIILILFNTLFYDYKGRLNNYLNTYFNEVNNNLDNINKLVDRYKNNTNKMNSINELLESDVNFRIDNFNKSYNSIEELTNDKDKLLNKFDYFFNNISNSVSLINNKETVTSIINKLFDSKVSYLTAIKYLNENNNNEAYNNFIKVIDKDSYYNDTTLKIDEMFNNEIKSIEDEINNILTINDDTKDIEKINVYKKALEYITNKKKELSFDISKSKTFNSIKENINNKLIELYLNISNEYINNNKINEAINLLNDSINYLNNNELNTVKLIEKRDELNKLQPISLTSIKSVIEGSSIKEELAISDINNDAYPKSITFYKVNKSSITYELNKEYKYLSGIINICKDVNQKKKNYGKITIYGDDKKLYDTGDLDTKYKKKDIKLNINDINKLKIEYTISNSKSINQDNILVALFGNPTLEKY